MPRYEVAIKLVQTFSMAEEADTPGDAQMQALGRLTKAAPEHTELEVTVDKGVN